MTTKSSDTTSILHFCRLLTIHFHLNIFCRILFLSILNLFHLVPFNFVFVFVSCFLHFHEGSFHFHFLPFIVHFLPSSFDVCRFVPIPFSSIYFLFMQVSSNSVFFHLFIIFVVFFQFHFLPFIFHFC